MTIAKNLRLDGKIGLLELVSLLHLKEIIAIFACCCLKKFVVEFFCVGSRSSFVLNLCFDFCSENKRHDVGDLPFLSDSECHCATQPHK